MSILILHTSNASRSKHFARAREYAKRHGERLLLIVKNPTWEVEYVDRVMAADTSSIKDTVAAAKELVDSEEEPVRGVATFVEHSVPAAAAVAAELNLPFVSEKTAYLARDKYAMRSAFADEGVPQPAFGLARNLDEAKAKAARIGYPLVIKPLIGGGSMYVRRLNNHQELARNFETIRKESWDRFDYDPLYQQALEQYQGALLLEAYLPGAEISVESLVVDGETRVIAIHDKPLPMNGPYFEEAYLATPSRMSGQIAARVREITAAAHRALGIQIGATHTEFRLHEGHDPMILETAARLGGGPIYQSLLLSTGVDMVEALLDLSLGREPNSQPKPQPTPTGFYLFFAAKAGKIRTIKGVEEAGADPHVQEIDLYKKVGDQVNVPPLAGQSHGHVIFTSDTQEELAHIFDRLTKTILLEIE